MPFLVLRSSKIILDVKIFWGAVGMEQFKDTESRSCRVYVKLHVHD